MNRHQRQRIASYYDGRVQRGYVSGKLAGDPVYAATAALIAGSDLPLLDIGCGIGLLGHYLHTQGHRRPYYGVDSDVRKIANGQLALRRAGLDRSMTLRHADASALPPVTGHVALLDMLHYLPAEQQRTLLHAAAGHLAPAGCLIIRNVLRANHWRFHLTRVEEYFLHASGWMRGGAQHYPDADELRLPLETIGLQVRIEPLRGHTPFNSYLIVARAAP